ALAPGQVFPLSIEADPVGGATLPTLSFSQAPASVIEGDANTTTNMTFTVTLSSLANGAVTVNYVTSDGTATASNSEIGDDYAISLGIITIPVTSLSATFDIAIYGDNSPESNETFNLTLSNASANVILGASTAIGTIIDDDYPERLNDTGVINCGYTSSTGTAAYTVDCAGTGVTTSTDGTISNPGNTLTLPAGQDALYGRDNLNNDDSDGLRGFSFTKLDANGNPLADQTQSYAAQPWSCVMDNHTGLIWEVKTTDKGLHDYWSTYTWYNSTGTDDSGDPGIANGGTCSDTGNCDTEKFISAVNGGATGSSNALCKTTNWRLPTTAELLSIVNNNGDSINSQVLPFIDTRFFPNAVSFIFTGGDQPTEYWTVNSSADPVTSSSAWSVFLLSGETKLMPKTSTTTVVRLVATGLTPRF
ncbi:Alkaline phosphatase, partial [hydrothermal vent metagenome]